jgi:peptide deformylase
VIITDEKILRQPCEDVKPEEVSELIALLEQELAASPRQGIGLAAIQIGIPKKAAIIRINEILRADLINCRIKNAYDLRLFQGEGCLSVPDKTVDTMRYNEIHVVDNELGFPSAFICQGLLSVAIQHELDHCAGVLMQDRSIDKSKKKVRPNDLCPCGSGAKYKRCCG